MRATSLLLPLAAAAALAAPSPGAAATADRLAAVTLDGRGATVFSGSATGIPTRRVFRGADRAVLSLDARRLAYTRRVRGTVEVRVAELVGAGDRLLARTIPSETALAFSPDGVRLAYSSSSGIAIVAVNGSGRRALRLPSAWRGSRYSHLAFTPDGRSLVVSRTTGDGRAGTLRNELTAVEVGSGRATTMFRSPNPYDQQVRALSFTPDGRFVSVDGSGSILLAPLNGDDPSPLTPRPPKTLDYTPLISPDGRRVAFSRTPDRGVSDVWVVGTDNTGLRRVTTTPNPPRGMPKIGAQPLAWSPDATKLLVFRHDRFEVVDVDTRDTTVLRRVGIRYGIASARWFGPMPEPSRAGTIVFALLTQEGTRSDLYTIRADGTGLRRLTWNGASWDPEWSPDASRIAFTAGRRERQLFTMAADGSDVLQLTPSGGPRWVFSPSWYAGGPTGLRLVFEFAEPGGRDGDLWTIGSDGRTMAPLTETPYEREENGSFSPDGALVYEVSRVARVDRDGVVTRIGQGHDPKWSPDGRRLLLQAHVGLRGGSIGVANADGTGWRTIAWGSTPAWSPDGTSIVYESGNGLFLMRSDGLGLPRRLTYTPELTTHLWPSWSATER